MYQALAAFVTVFRSGPIDSEGRLNFSVLEGVRSMNEISKFAQYKEAYDRMMSGKTRFRVGMTME